MSGDGEGGLKVEEDEAKVRMRLHVNIYRPKLSGSGIIIRIRKTLAGVHDPFSNLPPPPPSHLIRIHSARMLWSDSKTS